ncbi:MAG TPA: PIN domain-containing protein, partial [Thermoanaerobaculia bacterium]|nr:PIN domain-containing protein [Thermoanaerobaculia bacterium]
MSAEDALLFVDSNKYLDLYRTDKGKKLLAPLGEQAGYIFVTRQVVAEVERNKLAVAADFLNQKFRGLALQTFNVPDHLSGTGTAHGKDIPPQMRDIVRGVAEVNEKVGALALGIMEQISRSEDDVSRALAQIFASAVPHSAEELKRARDRREFGNPPGKGTNPLGDQLTWEQILSHFEGKTKLWIISRDGDYGTVYRGKGFLNRFLLEELSKITPAPEVYLFEDLVEGIEHFVRTTGVRAEQRLTPEEAKEIKEEERALPRLTQLPEDLGRAMAVKLSQPQEEMLRAMTEAVTLGQPSEEISRAIAEAVKLSQPQEEMLRAMAEAMKPSQPQEEMLRAMAEAVKPSQPQEEMLRAMAEAVKLSQPQEEMLRA